MKSLLAVAAVLWCPYAWAEVSRIEILRTLPYENGREFAGIGPYQRLLGKVHFTLDPAHARNKQIVDLASANRNAHGLVEFSADLEILAPVDLAKASGALLYDVNNRGNRLALGQFNGGGDHFLMRQGCIVVWSGWIAETLPGNERLRLTAPEVIGRDAPVTALVRTEMVADAPTNRMTIAQWANQGAYEPTEEGEQRATLTWRERESDSCVPIPRDQFQLHKQWIEADGQRGQLPLMECSIAGGFRPGFIYELIYEAKNPLVQGCGLAGIRDLVSHLKYDASADNPLASGGRPAVKHALGFGVSQSGRCLRMLLYDGFNADEQNRQVFDGLMPHVAGGGLGFFNHHFAMPTRHNGQHDNHLYPVDIFPFGYQDETHPYSGETDGILRKAAADNVVPKIMHVQTSAEYWHRSGSLVHTDPLGVRDAQLPPEVRIYAIGGAQHGAGSGVLGPKGAGQTPTNPTDYRPLMRALFMALQDWVRGKEPPPSIYPRIADGTLVDWTADKSGWRPLPGIRYPQVIQQPEWMYYGSDFESLRRIDRHPPTLRKPTPGSAGNDFAQAHGGRALFAVMAAAYDDTNNERGMLLLPTISVPLATFTGWNLRNATSGAESELYGLMGSCIPLCRTKEDRRAAGDPRPAVLERYRDFDDYLLRFNAAAKKLEESRYILPEDLPRLAELAKQQLGLFMSPK